ncbi:MAG: DUF2905 domain-containing protein [Deltaproteobacteria bacterium]|nr:DUF2905 domain-containing protein [Deltaproteobacteria bacterium]
MNRILIALGTILLVIGLLWPWLQKLPFGKLPGDIFIEKETIRFYFPLMTSLIISAVISLIFWFFRK